MNPYNKAHELAKALVECDEYKTMMAVRQSVEADPVAKKMLEDFHRRQMEFMQAEATGMPPSPEQMEQMQNLYAIISSNSVVRTYLEAEMRFGRLMADIQKILGQALDSDFEGGEE